MNDTASSTDDARGVESAAGDSTAAQADGDANRRTRGAAVALAWAVVALPALWGVSQTLRTSLRLFTHAGSNSTNSPSSTHPSTPSAQPPPASTPAIR